MAQAKQHSHPHPPAMTLEEWQRLVASQLGISAQEVVPPLPPDPAALALGLEKILGWGAPVPAEVVESVPIPPDMLTFQDVSVYTWARPSNPRVSVRAIANKVADEPDRVIADLQSVWVTAYN